MISSGVIEVGVLQEKTASILRAVRGDNGETAPTLDMASNPRVDDPSTANTGIGPPWADMGVFEFQI